MQRVLDALVFSPSDVIRFLDCEYLTRLDLDVSNGRILTPRRPPDADLLASKGNAHERRHLQAFRDQRRRVIEIPDPAELGWDTCAIATRDALSEGADVIYQGVLLAPGWRGRADFLVRVDEPSALGSWSYEAWDTKLARHAKPSHVLQLVQYTEWLSAIQKADPKWMHVILGSDEEAHFRYREFGAYARAVRRRFMRSLQTLESVTAYPVSHCKLCQYADHCEDTWSARDHLSLIAGIRRSQVERLYEAGVSTCAALASSAALVVDIGAATLERLRHQATLQAHFRATGEHRCELLPPDDENGLRLLPPPSAGDIFFDMEGFPFFDVDGGLEYLFGVVTVEAGRPRFHAFRADDRPSEKRAFEEFVDFVWRRLQRWPDLHVYHYSHYEPTALKRLMTAHATREEHVDELLRREAFVDLYQVVRRSVRISYHSYSIKAVRQFFMPEAGKGEVAGGAESILEYQRFLHTGDRAILDAIERYNEEDCVSTLNLREWLLDRRQEALERFGVEIPFRALPGQRDKPVEIEPEEYADLRGRLALLTERWVVMLGHLLDYHRREAKPEWWAYFERRKKSLDQLLEDTEAVAYLSVVNEPPVPDKRSLVHTLEFPPQEFKLKADTDVEGPLGQGRVGAIEWIDASAGRLGLRRGPARADEPLPHAVIACGPVEDKAQRAAIVRVAEAFAHGRDVYRAIRDVLSCAVPRFIASRRGPIQTLDLSEQTQLVRDLDESYLFIQGPPGSGKTWTGARLIVALIAARKHVGVTAQSHRAIHNLLEEVEAVAAERGVAFEGLKKRSQSDETAFDGRFITSVRTNEECEGSAASLIAATAWLFARVGMDQALDYLFVDEAGQMSLADVVAVGTSARNIVLLGDPQQLPHVTQNTHTEGSGVSVLEHLLGDAATVRENRGLFLAKSWRMHPDICRFVSEHFYDGRLESAPGCERQRITSVGLGGAGLRYIPVEHRHNAQQSPEEAEAIACEIARLLEGGVVTDCRGETRALTPADILVVAPYNMQVRCLREALPEDVDVGTVDKFQGREAAVVFFSMASSSGDEVPRGLEFLFNQNRFNVAISRARCLSVVVCSPRLLEARCATIDQMRLVNPLCRFVEQSKEDRRHC